IIQIDSSNFSKSLLCFKVQNSNPYNISHIYMLDTNPNVQMLESNDSNTNLAINIQPIDYIIFLDSDDYWKEDLLQKCLQYSNHEIVWFDYKMFCDGVDMEEKVKKIQTWLQSYGFTKNQEISPLDWSRNASKANGFASVWNVFIDFSFLSRINLKFLDWVIYEDRLFGVLLFMQAKSIFVLYEKLHCYRIRPNSLAGYKQNYNKDDFSPYIHNIYEAFDEDGKTTKAYHALSSWILMGERLCKFLQDNEKDTDDNFKEILENIKKFILPEYCNGARGFSDFTKDPLNITNHLLLAMRYVPNYFNKYERIKITRPIFYRFIIKPYYAITMIERNLRKLIKGIGK
ncbi:glycosyltransferase family 2 protein, partial [Helicobacter muridarum]